MLGTEPLYFFGTNQNVTEALSAENCQEPTAGIDFYQLVSDFRQHFANFILYSIEAKFLFGFLFNI